MKPVLQTITAAALAVVSVVTMAEERTGREFNELVRELNKELSEAKVKVRAIEAEHQAKSPKTEKKLLPERETAMRELSELSHDLKEARTDAEKQAAEQKVQDQILHVAELSTDFLERQKNELVNQDKQLAVMEDALSNVILKLDKLAAIAGQEADTADGKTEEERRVAARRELQGMARMVEMFAKKNPNSRHWRSVRQTIMLHDAVLRGNGQNGRKLQDILGAQKQMYEQTHAQIILARKAIAEERGLLGRIALGEVARSTLRKAANLLLGNHSVQDIGKAALDQSTDRQAQLFKFLAQDREVDTTMNPASAEFDRGTPEGYADFLNEDI